MKKHYRVVTAHVNGETVFDFEEFTSPYDLYPTKEEAIEGYIKSLTEQIQRLSELREAARTAVKIGKAITNQ